MSENSLKFETSPYLRQHAGNPVDWRPWSQATLEEARQKQKPLLISIGYAACHWCHVMAHESFEDERIAQAMNAFFVNVKVDREERPDIDHIYMSALHAMGEQGGWPLTMFATPEGAPFWGGAYFPPTPRWGKPSFEQVLFSVEEAWRLRKDSLERTAGALSAHLRASAAPRSGQSLAETDVCEADLDGVRKAFLKAIDPVYAGLGGAPKFPNAPVFRFLWHDFFRTGDDLARTAVFDLLKAMSQGGIYDHLGGGFSRYSVDREWRVPHFEKMLYDNAQILELLTLACAWSPNALFAARARETVDWLMREMRVETPQGFAFAASLDADSEGEEGRFYVWRPGEIEAALGADAQFFKSVYDVRAQGNWEGVTVLRRLTPVGDAAQEQRLHQMRAKLFALRENRPRPARDDKILADWNGLMIAALAKAACVFDQPLWLETAIQTFHAIDRLLRDEAGVLAHSWRERISAQGQLSDIAAMARAALALFEANGSREFLDKAQHYAKLAQQKFSDGSGGFFLTNSDAQDVPTLRPRTARDDATPSAAGHMAEVLAKLARLTGEREWDDFSHAAIRAFCADKEQLAAFPTLLTACDILNNGVDCVVSGPNSEALLKIARAAPDPALCLSSSEDGADWPENAPAFARKPIHGAAAAYLCRQRVCGLPITDPALLAKILRTRNALNTKIDSERSIHSDQHPL